MQSNAYNFAEVPSIQFYLEGLSLDVLYMTTAEEDYQKSLAIESREEVAQFFENN